MPPALFLSLPSCFAVGFMRPKNAGFPAAGVGMWWVGPVARSLYVFENPSGVFTNKACCLWIALFFFYVFHRLCVVFDVLTYMCLLTARRRLCQIKQIIWPVCGYYVTFSPCFCEPTACLLPACLPTYPTFTVGLTGWCEPNYHFICYEPIRRLFKGLFNFLKKKGSKMLWFFKFCNLSTYPKMFGRLFMRGAQRWVLVTLSKCVGWSVFFICSQQT